MPFLSKSEVIYLQGQKRVSRSYEYKLKFIIKKKISQPLDKELSLLSKSFPDIGLTRCGKNINNANSAKKNPEYEKISLMDNNKLYNCKENNHPKRARSVVRISRRSSEPQTVGSKPIGPVYFFSNISR
jgi:hypothetical protein